MKIINWFISLLYPRKCPFCRRLIDEQDRICKSCKSKLPFITHRPPRTLEHIRECYSALSYEGTVRDSLLRYKFHGAVAYAEIYGDFLTKCIDENAITCDIITWVPLSRGRLRKRGYDQARILAEYVSDKTGIECAQLLRKKRNNRAQSSISDAATRRKNVKGVYELAGEPPYAKTILLIDDIVTTGSSMSECAKVLKSAGAKEVIGLTVASGNK